MEAALSIYLENFATTLESREQLAIAEFATALLVIPKVTFILPASFPLLANAGKISPPPFPPLTSTALEII